MHVRFCFLCAVFHIWCYIEGRDDGGDKEWREGGRKEGHTGGCGYHAVKSAFV